MTGSNKRVRFFLYFFGALFLSSVPLSLTAGIISFESAYSYSTISYTDYNGSSVEKSAQSPTFGFSVSGFEPGWHPRMKILANYRNFHVPLPSTFALENSSSLKGQLGLQWIFSAQYGISPFVATALQYQSASIKFNYLPLDYTYGYYYFRRISIPFSTGAFFSIYKKLYLTLEAEADFLAISSSFHREIAGFTPWDQNPYSEHNFSVSCAFGFAY